MDSTEAKRILIAYRSEFDQPPDPEVAAALELAQADPELRIWLAQMQEFHRAMRADLRSIPVPSGLKARLLTQQKKVIPLWRRPEVLLAAACLTVGLFLSILFLRPQPEDESFGGFRSRMVSFALREYRMDILTNNATVVRQFLKEHGAPADYALTPGLQARPVKGGARLAWHTNPVGMVCFNLPKNETLYMFVMDKTAIQTNDLPGAEPVLAPVHGIMTASWSRAGRVYLVAAADPAVLADAAGVN